MDTMRDGVFVHRVDRRAKLLGVFDGDMVAGAVIAAVFAGVSMLSEHPLPLWAAITIFLLGTLLFPVTEFIGNCRTLVREVDREGVSLLIDDAGVYFGGRTPRRIDWSDIDSVTLTYKAFGSEEGCGEQDFAVFHPKSSQDWKSDPFRTWLPAGSHDAIRAVVRRHAPQVPINGKRRQPGGISERSML